MRTGLFWRVAKLFTYWSNAETNYYCSDKLLSKQQIAPKHKQLAYLAADFKESRLYLYLSIKSLTEAEVIWLNLERDGRCADTILGGSGDDTLNGDAGADKLTGGCRGGHTDRRDRC